MKFDYCYLLYLGRVREVHGARLNFLVIRSTKSSTKTLGTLLNEFPINQINKWQYPTVKKMGLTEIDLNSDADSWCASNLFQFVQSLL